MAQSLAPTYRVLTAPNGKEGWTLAREEMPDVVISDVMMPEMDGYQLCQLIKTDAQTDHIAVLLLTARASHESRIQGLAGGADDYLTKPFHFDELQLRARNMLDRQQKLREFYLRQLSSPETILQPKAVEDPLLKKIYGLIEARLDDSAFGVEELASCLCMTRRTLHRKLMTLPGFLPNEVIRNYRLNRAAELLRSGCPVSETAYRVGFENPSYFGTVFKEFYQKTPTEFASFE